MMNFKYIRKSFAGALCFAAPLVVATPLVVNDAKADQVFNDDVIITFSLCVGNDCVNGENFGFDTIRLKENNTRIKFDDTSNSSSFPKNDWQLTANDTTNGGDEKFSIDDVTNGRTPFTIRAGARTNSLYVDGSGRIGVGTRTPVLRMHMVDGNSPALRLEQDGSSGFTPQTWDVAGNEANFFVRDVTNGSALPFKIFPNAPTNALIVEGTTGHIGLGTASPAAMLELENGGVGVDGLPRIMLDNTDASSDWVIDVSDTNLFRISVDGSGIQELSIDPTGNLTITGGLISTGGGGACTLADPCDLVFDESVYTVPSIEDHAREMWANKFLPAVGSTRAGEPINVTVKLTRMLNELEKAHIYIEQLNKQSVDMRDQIAAMQGLLSLLTSDGIVPARR